MDASIQGRAQLALFEGNELAAYQDSVGVWTIGVGDTAASGASKPTKGMWITAAESDAILARDLASIYEPTVERNVRVPLKQHEFDALLSFTFNLGEGNLRSSRLLAKLNAGDRAGAADGFLAWNKAGGRVLAGLTRRRKAERAIFLTGAYTVDAPRPSETNTAIKAVVTLRKGMPKSDAVREMQVDLAALGFYRGKLDGDFGNGTLAAVRAFQRSRGLSDDGIAGLKTLAALDLASAKLPIAA